VGENDGRKKKEGKKKRPEKLISKIAISGV